MQLEDREILKKVYRNSKPLKLSFGTFYISRREDIKEALNELIVYHASKDIGIISPSVQLVKFSDKDYFILTQDLNDLGKFQTAENLGLTSTENSSLLSIFYWVQSNFNNPDQLIIDIAKIYLLDLFFMIPDRHNCNWGMLENQKYNNVCILDNEKAFNSELPPLMKSFTQDQQVLFGSYQELRKKDLEFFLQHYGKSLYDIFVSFYNLFTPEYFNALLDKIEQEEVLLTDKGTTHIKLSDRDTIITQYQKNYDAIGEVKNKFDGIKKL